MSYDPNDHDQPTPDRQPPASPGPEGVYGTPPPASYPMGPAPHKRAKWPYAVLAGAVLFAAGGVWVAYDRGLILKDPGIQACEALAAGDKTFSGEAQNKEPMTEAQYREMRGVFEASRYNDIKDHGTKLMDVVWQVSQLGEEPGMEVLAYLGPLTTHMTGLQSACADQGIIVTLKPAAAASSAPAALAEAEVGIPACADVFTAGKTIADDLGDECENSKGQPWTVLGMDCTDGRKLYQVDASSGAKPGWGFAGSKYRAEDTAGVDSKFAAALTACFY